MIDNVRAFHVKFGLPTGIVDHLTHDYKAQEFRLKFLEEELDELREALNQKDKVKMFDALLDLAYVTYGTALFAGITPEQWVEGMKAVHRANMSKIRVENAEDSKRGSAFDVRKPDGWIGPEAKLAEILNSVV